MDPQPTNEELADKAKASDESFVIRASREFRHYREGKLEKEDRSPIKLLRSQKHGGPHGGFYHDNCRNDPVTAFKLWHMCCRMESRDFPPQHPCEKYRASETKVFQAMARLDPVYMGRKSKNDIVFRAGDLRSTYDEELLEKSSDAGLRVGNAHKKLYEKLLPEGGTLQELENVLHYFLACKITAEEAGDLVLEDEQAYHQGNTDIMLDGPPVYTSKDTLSILTVNLGNFVRGRKKTVPAKFAQHVDSKEYDGVGLLAKSLARSKSHIACVLEASNVGYNEMTYLCRHGWYTQTDMGRDSMIMTRTNQAGAYIEHLAGPMCEPDVHQYLPLSYWAVEIRYGKSPSAAAIRKTESNLQNRFSRGHMDEDIDRCGMPVFRICVFHMSTKVASRSPPSCMRRWALCWLIASTTRSTTSPATLTFCAIAPAAQSRDPPAFVTGVFRRWSGIISRPKTRHRMEIPTAVLRLSLLRQIRSHCSGGWRTGSASPGRTWARSTGNLFQAWTAWSLASLSGRIASQSKWSQTTDPTDEYKVRISERLLHSNRDVYMLPESDNDSHTPLLVHLTPSWMSNKERRELRNPDTLKAAHDRRREAQRAKKRGDPAPSAEETPGTGSARPAEPENPPSGKGKRPAEPADPPLGKGKGKRPAEPADPPKGKGKKGESQKGKKGDYKKGKSKKGSSKGSTEKGKSKGKHYSKGKGQKVRRLE